MTAQQQLDAFFLHCGDIRTTYFYKFKKRSSSLKSMIANLETQIRTNTVKALMKHEIEQVISDLEVSSPKDHKKYLPAIRSLMSVWGTTKDYVRLVVGANLPVTTKYWNPVTGALGDVPRNIAISSPYAGYHEVVRQHLVALSHIPVCNVVLTALDQYNQTISIIDHMLTNQCQCALPGMKLFVRELHSNDGDELGPQTQAALNLAMVGGKTRALWLADKINATPRYILKGVPAVAAGNYGVTEAMVNLWIGGRKLYSDFPDGAEQGYVVNAIIAALYNVAANGPGCGANVNYTLGNANPLNEERPPAIGLAHELVHAYYSSRGEQPGFEVEKSTTTLFEYRCVGLGPWANAAISENTIRAAWNHALLHFDPEDVRDIKAIGNRDYYSAP